MYHSVTFGTKNTWDDWRLVPSSRPLFEPPEPKKKTIDIPGGDGVIDLSLTLTGYPLFANRQGSMEFYVMNDFKPWQEAYSDILNYLHGQQMIAILEDDPEYFYRGRFEVNTWRSEKDWSRIVIDYDVNPYKWSNLSSIDDWLWDPFNFRTGVVRTGLFRNIAVDTTHKLHTMKADIFDWAPVCPKFIVHTDDHRGIHIRFINRAIGVDLEKLLPDGESQIPEFVFFGDQGAEIYLWSDYSKGTVSIDFRLGRL